LRRLLCRRLRWCALRAAMSGGGWSCGFGSSRSRLEAGGRTVIDAALRNRLQSAEWGGLDETGLAAVWGARDSRATVVRLRS
jgi:hypothetical protein